ncbi:hypothetical protein EYF80_048989 [Liparis tanakae]|uniref:Uncharacterized protein n=1 Tax=Liparis tanakae TaxID=230148 RepID=A0A4Z2FIR9_9TELE|nr:hypothetical protein EYF80_048989 [Liparis tanakae]
MSTTADMLRAAVTESLAAAAGHIFGAELARCRRENGRQRRLLDAVLKPEVRLHRAGVQQDTKPPNIKEEPEGEPLPGPAPVKTEDDEAQSSQLHHTQEEHVGAEPPVGSSAQQVEGGGEDRGGSEPARSTDPDGFLQPANTEETPGSSDRADTIKM